MIFNSIPWFLVAGFFMCCGCALAAIVLDRKYRDARRSDEENMTERLQERLDAYDELEVQITSVIGAFEQHDRSFKELFGVQKQHIRQLQNALTAQSVAAPQPEFALATGSEESSAWMDDVVEAPVEVVVDESGSPSVADLRRKLEHARAEHEVVLERERQSLHESRERIVTLQPMQEIVRQRDAELAALRSELEAWQKRCAELQNAKLGQTARMAEGSTSLAPLVEELAKTRDIVREWEAKTNELAAAKANEIGALNERLLTLEPMVQQASESRADADKWREEYRALEARAAQSACLYEDEVQRLRANLAEFEGRFEMVHVDLAAARMLEKEATARADELKRGLDAAQLDLTAMRDARETAEAKNAEFAAQVEGLDERCEAQVREIETLGSRCEELDRTTNRQVETLAVLEARAKELDSALTDKAKRLATVEERARDLEQRSDRLASELESARREHGDARRAADERIAALQTEIAGLSDERRSLRAAVEEWTERCQGHERSLEAKTQTLADREQRLSELSARVEVLNLEIARERDEIGERDRRLHELGAKLERADLQVQKYRAAMSAHAQQFEVAQTLLAELKPVIENLGNELTNDKVGQG
jgi:chromosome segregation ATPase